MSVNRYKNNKPKFILENFFSGEISAWGLFEDPFGIIRKRFTCKITGKWDDKLKTLKITEDFLYDDGVKENRNWELLKKLGEWNNLWEKNFWDISEAQTTVTWRRVADKMKKIYDY